MILSSVISNLLLCLFSEVLNFGCYIFQFYSFHLILFLQMFFFAETFFMCFQIICNWLLKCFYASSVQSLISVWLLWPPWTVARQDSLSITKSGSLLKLMSIKSVMPSNHLILCCPFLLPPSICPTSGSFQMSQFFTSGGQSIEVSASASVLPMNVQDWFPLGLWYDLLVVQGTLKRLLQHHSSKASVLRCSDLFMVQLSHLYMTTGKTIAESIRIFVRVVAISFSRKSSQPRD